MDLVGKYIQLTPQNYKTIIVFLYSKGYHWGDGKIDMNSSIDEMKLHMESYSNLYLTIRKDAFYVYPYELDPLEYTNINKYLREEKLKRILK